MSKSGFTRNEIHRHNGHFGRVAMMRAGLHDIVQSATATDESKQLADEMLGLSHQLYHSLKTRRPPPSECDGDLIAHPDGAQCRKCREVIKF